ncbi:ABC transporter permease [Ilumatobacter nonamiensis]|uniref:ABC transporter permease n=1 Tax=Ilumatobacter nonamiensis TaxID=467093 RepID=UPI00034CFEAB|nr:ABC transporter permease [Ilumatobacter nonamiensis]
MPDEHASEPSTFATAAPVPKPDFAGDATEVERELRAARSGAGRWRRKVPDPLEVQPARGLWGNAFRQLLRKKSAVVGMVMLGILVLVAVFAPLIAPYDPNEVLLGQGVTPRDAPCIHLFGCAEDTPQHILGTDGNGRDEFSRILFGARVSLAAGVGAVLFAVVIGTAIGLVAGYYGRWADSVLMRLMDVLLAFPSLLLAIFIVTVFGPGLVNAIFAISIVSIPIYARVVRSTVVSLRESDFVKADIALGVSTPRIIWHRILPNSLTPLIVQATLGVATAVLEIAALSFLGLGVQPPTAEWGSMLAAERNQVFTAPHLVFFPGIAIMWNVLAFNLLGDGLRDALDPRLNL